jgi:hypothetical protein
MKWNCPKACNNCQGDVQLFMIKANLQFPQDESFMGFHSDFVNTSKEYRTKDAIPEMI